MLAIVDVDLAVVPCEPRRTSAAVLTNSLLQTLSSMLTRVSVALVHLLVTSGPGVPFGAVADVPGEVVLAHSPCARVVPALVHICLAALAIPAGLTTAVIVVNLVSAPAIVEARIACTLVHIFLTEPPSVAWLALAPILVDLVHAVTTVQARVG